MEEEEGLNICVKIMLGKAYGVLCENHDNL